MFGVLVIVGLARPDDPTPWLTTAIGGAAAYGLVLARRLHRPPIELGRLSATLPLTVSARARAKLAWLLGWWTLFIAAPAVFAALRQSDPVVRPRAHGGHDDPHHCCRCVAALTYSCRMTGWRQAVFVRQRRIDVIQRALSKILDEESWSPATPRRLHVGSADASSRGWTMIVPELANFFLDRGGTAAPRLCRLARELRCPAYEVDVRGATATTLFEVDPLGRMRISGSPIVLLAGLTALPGDDGEAELTGLDVASEVGRLRLLSIADDMRDRIAALDRSATDGGRRLPRRARRVPGVDAPRRRLHPIGAAGELIYEPPRIVAGAHAKDDGRTAATAELMARLPETREASARDDAAGRPACARSKRQTTSVRRPASTLTTSDATLASTR